MTDVLLLLAGIAALLGGGTAMVTGSSAIAERLGISPLVVGLTVVAFGTSSPELVVNMIGAFQGETDIAFGNVSGSNIANLLLVLGAAALLTPIEIEGQIVRRELPLLLLASTVLLVMILDVPLRGSEAILDRSDGLILLSLFCIFIYITVNDFRRQQQDPLVQHVDKIAIAPKEASNNRDWILIAGGILGLAVGGQITITAGVSLAESLAVDATVIGLAVIAVGTSLPELITSIIAAWRKEADLCVGNVIGSNIFNSLLVLPISALIHPLAIPSGGTGDVLIAMLFAIALIPLFFIGNAIMNRSIGIFFLLSYFSYMGFRFSTAS